MKHFIKNLEQIMPLILRKYLSQDGDGSLLINLDELASFSFVAACQQEGIRWITTGQCDWAETSHLTFVGHKKTRTLQMKQYRSEDQEIMLKVLISLWQKNII